MPINFVLLTPDEYAGLVSALNLNRARIQELEQKMATIPEAMAAMRQEVAEAQGAAASAKVLIGGLAAKVAELAAAAAAGQAVADELTTLANTLSGNTDDLAAAVAANPVPDGGGSGPVVA